MPQVTDEAVYFFFQAEDGIRDYKVTGVQTCALPIWTDPAGRPARPALRGPWRIAPVPRHRPARPARRPRAAPAARSRCPREPGAAGAAGAAWRARQIAARRWRPAARAAAGPRQRLRAAAARRRYPGRAVA